MNQLQLLGLVVRLAGLVLLVIAVIVALTGDTHDADALVLAVAGVGGAVWHP